MKNIRILFLATLTAGLTITNTFAMDARAATSHTESSTRQDLQIQSSLSVLPDELIVKILADSIEDDFIKCTDQSMLLKKINIAITELKQLRLVNHEFANFLTNETIIYILRVANLAAYANQINPDTGEALLHMAIRRGKYMLAKILIKTGADVNKQLITPRDPKITRQFPVGTTPLHTAIKAGNLSIVELLVHYGANITATITKYEQIFTPLDIARNNGDDNIIHILENAYTTKGIAIPATDEIENDPVFINAPQHN